MLLKDMVPGRELPCQTAEVSLDTMLPPREMPARVFMAVEREYARRLEDVLYISTYWGHERHMTREWLEPIAREMAGLLEWTPAQAEAEVSRCLEQQGTA